MDKEAANILSPDLRYVGGFSQFRKIAVLGELAGLEVIPHDGVVGVLHAMLSQPPYLCPIGEYLLRSSQRNQALYKEGFYPVKGTLKLPNKPGLGLEINEDIITSRRYLEF